MSIRFYLENIQSPINLASIIRICHFFQIEIDMLDLTGVLKAENEKTLHDFSSGSYLHKKIALTGTTRQYLHQTKPHHRIIATTIDKHATVIHDFEFQANDIVVLGNEYNGISEDIIEHADCFVTIPSNVMIMEKTQSYHSITSREETVAQSGVPCLNVATASAIIAYEIQRQMAQTVKKLKNSAQNDARMSDTVA